MSISREKVKQVVEFSCQGLHESFVNSIVEGLMNEIEDTNTGDDKPRLHFGVDVSGWQKPDKMDWKELVDDGYTFAIVKASEGMRPMSSFQKHVTRARDAGMPVIGAYHFSTWRKGKYTPILQAKGFLSQVHSVGIDGPLVNDMEWQAYKSKEAREKALGKNYSKFPSSDIRSFIAAFHQVVKSTIKSPWLYTGASFHKYRIKDIYKINEGLNETIRLWQAAYRNGSPAWEDRPDSIYAGGPGMWQYKGGKGRAEDRDGDGVVGYPWAIDHNMYYGTLEGLRA